MNKDQLMELESCIDEIDMWELCKSYNNVLSDIKKYRIANKHFGQTPDSLLLQYLVFKNSELSDDYYKSKLGV